MPESKSVRQPDSFGPVAVYYDDLMAGVPYRFWADYIERIWSRHDLAPRVVLDVACGTGTATRILAQRGYEMTGVDLSSEMLRIARERAAEEGLDIPLYRQDASAISLLPQKFDAAISLFDSLNYILDPADLRQAFLRVAEHLSPGGSLLFDLNTEYALAEGMFNQSCTRRGEKLHYRWRSRYDADARLCTVHMRFTYDDGGDERKIFTEVHRQRAYHKDEIVGWLHDAGFEQTHVYDAYSLDPPKKRSDRLFYLAIKGQE